MAVFNQFFGLRGRSLSTAITVVCGLIFVTFGYGQSDVGGLVTIQSFRTYFPEIDFVTYFPNEKIARQQGIVVAAWNLGCFFSAILTIFIGDKLGRRRTLILGCGILAIGKIIQASSFGLPQYIVGRLIAGFGNGFNASTAPAWQAECTKAHRRGRMLMVSSGACIALGCAIAYWVDFGMYWTQPDSASWRFPIATQILFVLPCFFFLSHLPESPRWLILQGREKEALEVLGALNDLRPDHENVRAEFLQVKDAILQMASGSQKDAFSNGDYRYRHRIILASLLQLMQQFSGVNLFMQYLGEMFVSEGKRTGWVASILAACAATFLFLTALISVVGIDRFWGRRQLTMFGSTGMSLCMAILAIMHALNTVASSITLCVFLFVYIAFFSIGWQGMAWLWAVELTPLPVRGPANALSTAVNWISNFIVVLVAPIMFANIGYGTYVIFAVLNAVFVPILYLLYPDTGCRSLEEVDVLFHVANQAKRPWLAVRDVAIAEPLWYGKNGRKPFAYEESEWHMRFARLSNEEEKSSGPSSSSNGMSGRKEEA